MPASSSSPALELPREIHSHQAGAVCTKHSGVLLGIGYEDGDVQV